MPVTCRAVASITKPYELEHTHSMLTHLRDRMADALRRATEVEQLLADPETVKDAPRLAALGREHHRLAETVQRYQSAFARGECPASELMEFLIRWLFKHIAGADSLIGEAWRKKQAPG